MGDSINFDAHVEPLSDQQVPAAAHIRNASQYGIDLAFMYLSRIQVHALSQSPHNGAPKSSCHISPQVKQSVVPDLPGTRDRNEPRPPCDIDPHRLRFCFPQKNQQVLPDPGALKALSGHGNINAFEGGRFAFGALLLALCFWRFANSLAHLQYHCVSGDSWVLWRNISSRMNQWISKESRPKATPSRIPTAGTHRYDCNVSKCVRSADS
jgi:hypothetical protein